MNYYIFLSKSLRWKGARHPHQASHIPPVVGIGIKTLITPVRDSKQ